MDSKRIINYSIYALLTAHGGYGAIGGVINVEIKGHYDRGKKHGIGDI